jgi:hypothetical protein
VRTLLYEAANVMLTRYKGQLKLKDWAFAIAKRSTMRKARVALARRLAIIMHAICETGRSSHPPKPVPRDRRPNRAPARSDALGREQTTARILLHGPNAGRLRFQPSALHPAYPISAERARRERRHPESVGHPKEPLALDTLGNSIRKQRPWAIGAPALIASSCLIAEARCRRVWPINPLAPSRLLRSLREAKYD